jgi:hypothetical protein
MEVRSVFFCHQDETIIHLFFQCYFARSIWSVIQVAPTLFPPCNITKIFGNLLNEMDNRVKKHIRVGAIALIWSLYVEMIKCLTIKTLPFRRLSTELLTLCLWSSLQRLQDRDLYTEVCA